MILIVTLFLHLHHYSSAYLESPLLKISTFKNTSTSLSQILLAFTTSPYKPLFLDFSLPLLMFWFCTLNVTCMSLSFVPLKFLWESLQDFKCSVTVTEYDISGFYQNNVEKSHFIYWKFTLNNLKAAIWFQFHHVNARQYKKLSL